MREPGIEIETATHDHRGRLQTPAGTRNDDVGLDRRLVLRMGRRLPGQRRRCVSPHPLPRRQPHRRRGTDRRRIHGHAEAPTPSRAATPSPRLRQGGRPNGAGRLLARALRIASGQRVLGRQGCDRARVRRDLRIENGNRDPRPPAGTSTEGSRAQVLARLLDQRSRRRTVYCAESRPGPAISRPAAGRKARLRRVSVRSQTAWRRLAS